MDTNTPLMRWVRMTAYFVSAFAAIYIGVMALGWEILGLGLLIKNAPAFVLPLLYAIGIFGLISLVLLLLDLMGQEEASK